MSKKLRFAIQGHTGDQWCSGRWSAFSRKDDFYVVPSGIGAAAKISLHASGVCRYTLTSSLASHNPPFPENDRVILRWMCGSAKDIQHTHIMSIYFLTVGAGRSRPPMDAKRTALLPRAIPGYATEVAVFLSETNPLTWTDLHFIANNIFGVWELPNRGFLALRRRIANFDSERFQHLLGLTAGLPQMHVGEENPTKVGAGMRTALLAEGKQNFASFYVIDPVDITSMMGSGTAWSTTSGNKFKA